jgi:hypothetical protein
MAGILDLLGSEVGQTIIKGVSNETKQPENKTKSILTMAMPVLIEAMKRNANTPEGGAGLMNAVATKHNGSILDNLESFFEGGVNESDKLDGSKILGHILGNKTQSVEKALGSKAGLDAGSVDQILKVAAPVLLGMIGKQANQSKAKNPSDLTSILGGLLSNNSADKKQDFLTSILDANGDGSIMDDVAGMVLNKGNKGGIGGLLGNLFGKK